MAANASEASTASASAESSSSAIRWNASRGSIRPSSRDTNWSTDSAIIFGARGLEIRTAVMMSRPWGSTAAI